MVENEPFMYDKLVAGRDAKSGKTLTFEPLALVQLKIVRCITVQAKSVEIHVNVHLTEVCVCESLSNVC